MITSPKISNTLIPPTPRKNDPITVINTNAINNVAIVIIVYFTSIIWTEKSAKKKKESPIKATRSNV